MMKNENIELQIVAARDVVVTQGVTNLDVVVAETLLH